MLVDMRLDMCVDMCVDVCVGKWFDMPLDMCADISVGIRLDMRDNHDFRCSPFMISAIADGMSIARLWTYPHPN